MKRTRFLLLVLALSLFALGISAAVSAEHHVNARLQPANGSGISGMVELTALPKGGTQISGQIQGLQPGTEYLSLYYENHTCELEPYSSDDIIARYTADSAGRATFSTKAGDDLDEINSISVRLASDFSLKACADTHP
jgi:hypothetical protein